MPPFDRRVAHHIEQLLVAPNVGLARRDIEIADKNRRSLAAAFFPHGSLGCDEIELMLEFVVGDRVGHVAAGRHIDIVECDAARQFGRSMAAILAPAMVQGRRR